MGESRDLNLWTLDYYETICATMRVACQRCGRHWKKLDLAPYEIEEHFGICLGAVIRTWDEAP